MRILPFFKNSGDTAGQETLKKAVQATRRSAGRAVLSTPARDRILDAARIQADSAGEMFPSLFTAPRKLIAAGVLPLVLAAGLLVLLNQRSAVTPDLVPAALEMSKQDGQVFIRIANGKRDHVVYRSTVPDRFERAQGVTVTNGSFTDAIDDNADLVFYRID